MGNVRVAMVDVAGGNVVYYFLNDRLGTPEILTDAAGTVVWESWYDPFGEGHVHPSSSVVNNHRLPGQYFDQETGLHYNYHRYYDPKTGRFITADPIGHAGGMNLYLYVRDNPANLTDPRGLKDLGKLASGGSIIFLGLLQAAGGLAIAIGGAGAEIAAAPETGFLSLVTIPKTIGLGLAISGAGILEVYAGQQLFREGWAEDRQKPSATLEGPSFRKSGVILPEERGQCE
jgi:RHS repeat-associated protein